MMSKVSQTSNKSNVLTIDSLILGAAILLSKLLSLVKKVFTLKM